MLQHKTIQRFLTSLPKMDRGSLFCNMEKLFTISKLDCSHNNVTAIWYNLWWTGCWYKSINALTHFVEIDIISIKSEYRTLLTLLELLCQHRLLKYAYRYVLETPLTQQCFTPSQLFWPENNKITNLVTSC